MSYQIRILRSAQKQLAKISSRDRDKLIASIRALGDDPRPKGCKKLSGRPAWRIRCGDYRVVYEIHDRQMIILVVATGHRREIYR